ncbi:DNA mismatch repair protein MutS [Blattabacterium cuenoti]|uniref:DNA mismatch repair protein MutS n=1 Tax=Blattabacterium cuenoti TaxID=1653831 RepID=UPI00163CDF48|nr:DNA mismatch repair protein MutS [Blattabacterium cuenoti]
MSKKKENTPLIQQYNDIKKQYPDTILLFQVGDFYEAFGKDAIVCSQTLHIVLTKRLNHIQLSGFPCHSLNIYLPKLIHAGFRVAICNQLEEPKKGKNLVKRGVVELITPGINTYDNVLPSKSNNFLASIHVEKNFFGLSLLDISTGEFFTTEDKQDNILRYIRNFDPSEILIQRKEKNLFQKLLKNKYYTFLMEDWIFEYSFAYEKLISHFKTNSLKGFGINNLKLGIISSGVILCYLHDTNHFKINHIYNIHPIKKEESVCIDDYTFQNLEIFQPFNKEGFSLLKILDQTITPMGGRLLKKWILFPSSKKYIIEKRQKIVKELCENNSLRIFINKQMKQLCDIERITSKISLEKVSPREIDLLGKSIISIDKMKKEILIHKKKSVLTLIFSSLKDCLHISDKIRKTIQENPPSSIEKGKGNVIMKGVSKELDKMRDLYFSQKEYVEKLCLSEKLNTGISNLKIGYSKIFGYYFEIKIHEKKKIPHHWIEKQRLSHCKRYLTKELKDFESKILHASNNIFYIEKKIFSSFIKEISKEIKDLKNNAKKIGKIDVLCSFSSVALENNYTMPTITNHKGISIVDSRHPVIEKTIMSKNSYIPNDIFLDKEIQQILMITGPNMSGKSAYLRQIAIIILMAHIGSFIPAKNAKIGIVDKIFSRVGAYDNISIGESTFMVEMNETANILNNITARSFIILDEIGRGTSMQDGISIAQSIVEFLHEHSCRPFTLFATHYHEITKMNRFFKRIKNFYISVKKIDEELIFMRKLMTGHCKNSFGIHIAKMAGIPEKVIYRAKKIFKTNLNNSDLESHKQILTISIKKMNDIIHLLSNEKIKVNDIINSLK